VFLGSDPAPVLSTRFVSTATARSGRWRTILFVRLIEFSIACYFPVFIHSAVPQHTFVRGLCSGAPKSELGAKAEVEIGACVSRRR